MTHKRRVNSLIHERVHELRESEPIAFFCECSSPRCFDTVWLLAGEYESARLDAEWSVLSPGHRCVKPGRVRDLDSSP